MEKMFRQYITVLVILIMASGCGGLKLSMTEREIIQATVDNLHQTEEYLEALDILGAAETHQEALTKLTDEFEKLVEHVPAVLLEYPEGIIPERIQLEEEQKDGLLVTAYPLSQKTTEQAFRLFEEIAVARLEQIASNLEIIWSVESVGIADYRRSPTYAEAHNTFLLARQHFPATSITPNMQYADQLIELKPETKMLVPKTEDTSVPGVITTATYIERSNKICEKILVHYLTQRGTPLISSFNKELSSSLPSFKEEEGFGGRILEALSETFGPLEAVPHTYEGTFKVYFRRGGYTLSHLSSEERAKIQNNTQQLLMEIQAADPDHPTTVTITTVGYTDESPLREGNRFVQNFIRNLEQSGELLPQGQPARKIALNRNFSKLRALIINEHIKQLVEQELGEDAKVIFVTEVIGKGEELPEGSTLPVSDEERRICQITIQVQRWSSPSE